MTYEELRTKVCDLNLRLVRSGLVMLTFGNASIADRQAGVFAIKPSGVDYAAMQPADMVVLSLDSGIAVESGRRPSSDTPTHWVIYREFASVGAVIHTHSTYASAWAQAGRPIPCLGTTHADHFYGEVPLSRVLTADEIARDYELNTGKSIVESFASQQIDPGQRPGMLVPRHGPFAWGPTPEQALDNAIALEAIAHLAWLTFSLRPEIQPIPRELFDKHFLRKHGEDAYYGQPPQV